jgi:FHS family L-fucose permease-like MFS transporter
MTRIKESPRLLYTVYFIYFICGMAMCFEGAFMPEFKEHFQLNYQQQMYIMFAKNIPFVFFSILIGVLSKRIGFKKCLTIAMFLFAAGTALLVPGLHYTSYSLILSGFFIIGVAFDFELVAGNPLLMGLGDPSRSSSRLNLGNALGAIAQVIAPLIIFIIVPVEAVTMADKAPYIYTLFIVIAAILAITGFVSMVQKDIKITSFEQTVDVRDKSSEKSSLWADRNLIMGFAAIFIVLGIESGIFGLYRNYVEDPSVAGLNSHQSYSMYTIYFAIFAAGRLAGAWFQNRIKPVRTLLFSVIAALILLILVITTSGKVALISITMIGFFISIFFPTLYAISIEGLGTRTGIASGLLTMGFLGAGVLPVIQGKLADLIGLKYSFLIGIICYLYVLYYAVFNFRKSEPIINEQ